MIGLFITLLLIGTIAVVLKEFFAIFGGLVVIGLIIWAIVKFTKKNKKGAQ